MLDVLEDPLLGIPALTIGELFDRFVRPALEAGRLSAEHVADFRRLLIPTEDQAGKSAADMKDNLRQLHGDLHRPTALLRAT